uniref:Uncharacterized protein n=1 Tax=Sexangularia sp. CB-2014 TaxID=1486929 RepID=A0A7S1VP03_9EUKA
MARLLEQIISISTAIASDANDRTVGNLLNLLTAVRPPSPTSPPPASIAEAFADAIAKAIPAMLKKGKTRYLGQAIDALFDVYEDDEVAVRLAVVRGLGSTAALRSLPPAEFRRIVNVLGQLLQATVPGEKECVSDTLRHVLAAKPAATTRQIAADARSTETPIGARRAALLFLTDAGTRRLLSRLLISHLAPDHSPTTWVVCETLAAGEALRALIDTLAFTQPTQEVSPDALVALRKLVENIEVEVYRYSGEGERGGGGGMLGGGAPGSGSGKAGGSSSTPAFVPVKRPPRAPPVAPAAAPTLYKDGSDKAVAKETTAKGAAAKGGGTKTVADKSAATKHVRGNNAGARAGPKDGQGRQQLAKETNGRPVPQKGKGKAAPQPKQPVAPQRVSGPAVRATSSLVAVRSSGSPTAAAAAARGHTGTKRKDAAKRNDGPTKRTRSAGGREEKKSGAPSAPSREQGDKSRDAGRRRDPSLSAFRITVLP